MPFHSLTVRWPLNLLINLLLACTIFANAEIGRQLGIKDTLLPISIIWPAAGFSLAALLLFGTKVWPGIFFGNFVYNFHILCFYNPTWAALATALTISGGSLLQALVANYIIRTFSEEKYLYSVKDVLVFLIPGGILSCLIASTIGIISLCLYQGITSSWAYLWHLWITFWIGDTVGVYLVTPFILVWSLHKFNKKLLKPCLQECLIGLLFIIIALLTIYVDFSLAILYILLGLLTTYYFGMHGATFGNLLIAFLFIIPFSTIGYPSFPTNLIQNPLLFFALLLATIVAVTLTFAAARKNRFLSKPQDN